MNMETLARWLQLDGRALYVWGAYAPALLLLIVEALLVRARLRRARGRQAEGAEP